MPSEILVRVDKSRLWNLTSVVDLKKERLEYN